METITIPTLEVRYGKMHELCETGSMLDGDKTLKVVFRDMLSILYEYDKWLQSQIIIRIYKQGEKHEPKN